MKEMCTLIRIRRKQGKLKVYETINKDLTLIIQKVNMVILEILWNTKIMTIIMVIQVTIEDQQLFL